jgi:hypothetical protein
VATAVRRIGRQCNSYHIVASALGATFCPTATGAKPANGQFEFRRSRCISTKLVMGKEWKASTKSPLKGGRKAIFLDAGRKFSKTLNFELE